MARDYFAVLGLAPGRYEPREIMARFLAERERAMAELQRATDSAAAQTRLDDLHAAFRMLGDAPRQAQYLRARTGGQDRVDLLRAMIAASLEDGLLRYSQRQAILDEARALGLNEFQTQLLIAQVQFGDQEITVSPTVYTAVGRGEHPRLWARVAAVGVLALAMFLALVQWVGA